MSSLLRPIIVTAFSITLTAWLPAQAPYRVVMEFDVRVPMRDGVQLSTDIYRPDAPGRFPVILVRTPYDNGTAPNLVRGKFWARRGYVYAVQDVRGRGDSDGEFYPLVHEAADGDATVSWLATRPWSNGKTGMVNEFSSRAPRTRSATEKLRSHSAPETCTE